MLVNISFSGMFATLTTFLEEREVFAKVRRPARLAAAAALTWHATQERSQAYYKVLPYFLAKSFAEFPLTLIPIVFGRRVLAARRCASLPLTLTRRAASFTGSAA